MCCSAPTADNVTKLLNEFSDLFGLVRAIRTDQGTAFTAKVVADWCTVQSLAQIFAPIGDHLRTGLVERLIRTLRSRIGTLQLSQPNHSYPALLLAVLNVIRVCVNATAGCSPYTRFFGRPPATKISNFWSVLDPRRVLQKGHWRQMKTASSNHLASRDSESDTDPDSPQPPVTRSGRRTRASRPASPSVESVIIQSSDETAVEVVYFTDSVPRRRGAARTQTVAEADTRTPTKTTRVNTPSKIAHKRIFMKTRPGAKIGTHNFVEITGNIALETPNTFTLTDGRAIRKNLTRTCLDPPRRGTFGTPPRLLYELVFVSLSATRAYQSSLSAAPKASRGLRNRYMARAALSSAANSPSPTIHPQSATASPVDSLPVRRSSRVRRAVVTPGAVPALYLALYPSRALFSGLNRSHNRPNCNLPRRRHWKLNQ